MHPAGCARRLSLCVYYDLCGSNSNSHRSYKHGEVFKEDFDPKTPLAETVEGANGVRIDIVAPFYNDPAPSGSDGSSGGSSDGSSGGSFFQLWDYEVVEAFFLAPPTKVIVLFSH